VFENFISVVEKFIISFQFIAKVKIEWRCF